MYYVGIAVDASKREVRFVGLLDSNPTGLPEFRTLAYGEADLPSAMRDLYGAVLSTLAEMPPCAVAVRRMDPPPPRHGGGGQSSIRTATLDRLLAEGAVLAAAKETVTNVTHITGADAASRLGLEKTQAQESAKQFLGGHSKPMKWAEATMVAQALL
jgi:hypothetical protein